MKLTWYGHSCFLLETAEGSVVFDPYAPGAVPGVALPEDLTADTVVCSHGHKDHGYAAGVKLSGRKPGFRVKQLDCWHDDRQGALRGKNTITVIEAEGRRIAHLGDLGHELSPAQLTALGRVDLLLIPVGGHYTIDAKTADRVARKIGAALTVPMHYRGPGFGYSVIGPVEDFLALCDEVVRLDSSEMDPELIRGPVTVLLRCPVKE
ncbi:MAG: MBL fold metallo-hydrolase [Oscillospiraceae bacterium]|nr:MBL fold metallo-hydrolase [Oscillospiraceae bacterium]